MKLYNRILSTLLAVVLLVGGMVVGVSAEASATTGNQSSDKVIESKYVGTLYKTPEEKLASMKLMMTKDGYELYIDSVSGEVATREVATGNILFSNPYDVGSSIGSAATKKQILSQIIIQYVDNGTTKYLYSFEEAAMRQQINVLNIKNGVRVEYSIGREETRKLVPRWISDKSFQKFIKGPMDKAFQNGDIQEFYYKKFLLMYQEKNLEKTKGKKAKAALLKMYPVCETMNIWVIQSDLFDVELNWCEAYVKTYCTDYTFEQMDADHAETGYVAPDERYPLFKMALEYSLDKNGLRVTLPCNGLRYDMTNYTLENISILPYMGAGNSRNAGIYNADGEKCNGYNFYPDGSGSLFDYEQLDTSSTTTVRGKVYGTDYAYHQISGTYQKTVRYPVYGSVASEKIYNVKFTSRLVLDEKTLEIKKASNGSTLTTPEANNYELRVSNTVMDLDDIEKFIVDKLKGTLTQSRAEIERTADIYERGFVAVIEEGESLAEIATYHAGALSDYNSMMNYFNPKPKDSYDLADSISVTGSSSWTVVSERKYTGSITIHYQMLTDKNIGKAAQQENASYTYYDTTWLGMAEAYRDSLVSSGKLKKLTEEKTEDNIPLYLEVFGALQTIQQIATIPVSVMTPLTTFENVYEMYDALSKQGIKNINFKLKGFANGGMYSTVPSKLKWEKAVGGAGGFEELIAKAAAVNESGTSHLGLYPDFDFAYIHMNTLFDDTNLKKDAVKTIDNRYSSLRQYSATQQTYISFYQLAVSPSRYSKFYEKLMKNYEKYGLNSMSVASLGTTLNSDFDEDDPYNREDGKDYTVQAFQDLKEAGYSLMSEGANAYSWGYLDHIINVDLDSSRYIKSSASVPFIGAVLHGYVQFAGTPFNKEGDTDYAILRAIENGAGLYFLLSYQNTNELKEDFLLSQHYSVRYDIWEEDVAYYYNKLNGLLKDVQNKEIIAHDFLIGKRVLDPDELEDDLREKMEAAAEAEKNRQEQIETEKVLSVANAWQKAENATSVVEGYLTEIKELNKEIYSNSYNEEGKQVETGYYPLMLSQIEQISDKLNSALKKLMPKDTVGDDATSDVSPEDAVKDLQSTLNTVRSYASLVILNYRTMEKYLQMGNDLIAEIETSKQIIDDSDLSDTVKENMKAKMDAYKASAEAAFADAGSALSGSDKYVTEGSEFYVVDIALEALEDLFAIMDDRSNGNYEYYQLLKQALVEAKAIYTAENILAAGSETEEDKEEEESVDQGTAHDKYRVDNNQIVVVTYGDRNAETHEKTAYKSFILNYNNFAVIVDYEDPTTGTVTTYTIPRGGYVVIHHQ